mmetsp:Transcript_15810/g.23457  ORF Transcript_15810/g.23457 Transcript_15810/m.23457 type:complete len:212 (+) Transcript_15810:117-752(+)|eukprot:scaffold3648_cov92-Skeletonema_dohrnii-CCMP3373.AAC.5
MPTECRVPMGSWPKSDGQNEKNPIAPDRKRTHNHLPHLRHDDILQDKRVKRSNEELMRPSNLSDVTSDDFGDVNDKDDIRKQTIQQPTNSDAKMKNCFDIIDKAEAEERIDAKKASRLRDCLHSDDAITLLLCEQIPHKRRGKGFYKCRVCEVPIKGHVCPYCPVCSTPQQKIEKNDDHVCINCIKCYETGKKRKKLVQVNKRECECRNAG